MLIHSINKDQMIFLFCFCFFIIPSFVATQILEPRAINSFCAGYGHACSVFGNKKMKCWGDSYSWGLADDNIKFGDVSSELGDAIPYIDLGANIGVEKVSCGSYHTCMMLDTGNMKCVGDNYFGEIGIGVADTASPIGAWSGHIGDNLPNVMLPSGIQVLDIALGEGHSCAKVTGNKVMCFGQNDKGQLGLGDSKDRGVLTSDMGNNLQYVTLGSDVEVTSIHSGSSANHNCVVLSAPATSVQKVKCWGHNRFFQLGYGTLYDYSDNRGDAAGEMGNNLPLVDFGFESKVKQLAIAPLFTCALLFNDYLKCFGLGSYGALGLGSTVLISTTGSMLPPVEVDFGKTVKLVSSGNEHTCIVYNDLVSMKCFGFNSSGQLGQGDSTIRGGSPSTMIPSFPAIQLGTGALKIKSIHSGFAFNCVVFEDNSVKCFGENSSGQLAIGSSEEIGNDENEMGNNLQFSQILPPATLCNYQTKKLCKKDKLCIWKKKNDENECIKLECNSLLEKECKMEAKRCKWIKRKLICEAK